MIGYIVHIASIIKHKLLVFVEMQRVCLKLTYRAIVHDMSKFRNKESKGFSVVVRKLAKVKYGSDEYKALLEDIKDSVKEHYLVNSHHPEFYKNGVDGMNIYDMIEMICDWKAAAKRHKPPGTIEQSFDINRDRFKISSELERILKTI